MNKRSAGWLHPAVIYFMLLLLIIIISWIGSIMEMRRVGGNGELVLRSVLGESGIRWAVRSASACIGQAPVGNAHMLSPGLTACHPRNAMLSISVLLSLLSF